MCQLPLIYPAQTTQISLILIADSDRRFPVEGGAVANLTLLLADQLLTSSLRN
jgi:hypothetical protein